MPTLWGEACASVSVFGGYRMKQVTNEGVGVLLEEVEIACGLAERL